MSAIKQACFICGNQSKLARAIGVKPQAVQSWCASGNVPANRVLAIEEATGGQVTRNQLRPDLYPISTAIIVDDIVLNRFKDYSSEPVTDAMLKGIENEAKLAGITLTKALNIVMDNGWRTFKARWYCEN